MNCSQNSLHMVASQWLEELVNNVLPFWQVAIDEKHGGVFTCFNNEGSTLLSHDKFTWSQGRFLWNWCRQAYLIQQGQLEGNANEYLAHAKLTAEFLDNHVFLENGHCSFVLTEQGDKKEQVPGAGFDTSFYADCFVVMGFCEYAYVADEASYFEKALTLYQSIRARLNSGKVRSEPYPAAEGFEPYAFEMITLGVINELLRYAIEYQHPQLAALQLACQTSLERIFNDFHDSDSLIPFEMRTAKENHTTLMAQHVTPGHTLENMWFCVEAASLLGQLPDYLPKIVTITKMMWTLGWDKEYLGLYRYTSRQGTQPSGDLLGNDPYENLVLDTWDTKIWWVHSEALYTLLLTYKLSGDEALFSMYEQTAHYVMSTFPNAEFGEWTQIRDRQGKPLNKVVALPVKDPFHIMRNLQLMVSLFTTESQVEKEVQC